MRRSLAIAFSSVALLIACALPSADEYASGSPDGGVGSSTSGGASGSTSGGTSSGGTSGTSGGGEGGAKEAGVAEAGEAGAGGNLFVGGDFEGDACLKQSYPFQGTAGGVADAHAGNGACQICRQNESTDYFSLSSNRLATPAQVGRTYRARAWVKRGTESFKDQTVAMAVRSANLDGSNFVPVEQRESKTVTLSNDWQLVEVSLTVTKEAAFVDSFVSSKTLATAGQRCVIVDDYETYDDTK